MARPRSKRNDLPECVYYKHGAYYFVRAGRWMKLDNDYAKAMVRWAEQIAAPVGMAETVGDLLDRYIKQVVPTKAPRTQKDNLGEIRFLRAALGHVVLADLAPSHVAQYRDARVAKTRANREIALLSHACSYAVEWGLLVRNPCREVRRNREKPRDRYITDAELENFIALCPPWLKTYIRLKALLGLRQQDMLALTWNDIDENGITVLTQKRKVRLKINLTTEVRSLLTGLPRSSTTIFATRDSAPYTSAGFGSIWRRLMAKYVSTGGVRFTEHDIRGKVATDLGDAETAKKLLGHKRISMTEDYIKQRSTDVVDPLRRNQ